MEEFSATMDLVSQWRGDYCGVRVIGGSHRVAVATAEHGRCYGW